MDIQEKLSFVNFGNLEHAKFDSAFITDVTVDAENALTIFTKQAGTTTPTKLPTLSPPPAPNMTGAVVNNDGDLIFTFDTVLPKIVGKVKGDNTYSLPPVTGSKGLLQGAVYKPLTVSGSDITLTETDTEIILAAYTGLAISEKLTNTPLYSQTAEFVESYPSTVGLVVNGGSGIGQQWVNRKFNSVLKTAPDVNLNDNAVVLPRGFYLIEFSVPVVDSGIVETRLWDNTANQSLMEFPAVRTATPGTAPTVISHTGYLNVETTTELLLQHKPQFSSVKTLGETTAVSTTTVFGKFKVIRLNTEPYTFASRKRYNAEHVRHLKDAYYRGRNMELQPATTLTVSDMRYSWALTIPNKILLFPGALAASRHIRVIDTNTDTVSSIPITENETWVSAVYTPDGRVIAINQTGNRFLELSPTLVPTYTTFNTTLPTNKGWSKLVCNDDGLIVGIPFNSNQFLLIDTKTNTLRLDNFGISLPQVEAYYGAVFSDSHTLWVLPYKAQSYLRLDLYTQTLSIYPFMETQGLFTHALIGGDGNVHAMSSKGLHLRLDTKAAVVNTRTTSHRVIAGGYLANGLLGFMTSNNLLLQYDCILDPLTFVPIQVDTLANADSYGFLPLGVNGVNYLIPSLGNKLYRLTQPSSMQLLENDIVRYLHA